jgi:hypothetical protein
MSEREEKPGHDGEPESPSNPPESGHDEAGKIDPEMQAVLDEVDEDGVDGVDVRDLLRSALAPPPGSVAPALLRGVQRKLRRRSRGKFYGDGWSTARAPRSTYVLTSVVMLALIAVVFFVLIPWGSGALP